MIGNLRRGVAGTATIELALAIPFLLITMTGVWDFGNVLFQAERIASAARAGVQFGVENAANAANFAGMIAAARADANDRADALTVTAQQTCTCPAGGSVSCTGTCASGATLRVYAQVSVSERYSTVFSYPFVGNPLTLTNQVMMRVQ